MARAYRAVAVLIARLWRSAPWLLVGGILLALGVLAVGGGAARAGAGWGWAALACSALAAPAALFFQPPRRPHPGPLITLTAYLFVVAAIGHLASQLIQARTNTFYSVALLTEGVLLLYSLTAVQAALRRISAPPTTAAPRAADAFMDGVSALLIAFLVGTAVALRPFAAVSFLLAIAFAALAVVLRAPGALARVAHVD
jgi:hypothetical protein